MALQSFVGPLPLFQFLDLVSRTPWTGDEPVARLQRTHRTTQTQNKRTLTSMGRVGFEDGSYLRAPGHCDRQDIIIVIINSNCS
jgi:hypothetical protein